MNIEPAAVQDAKEILDLQKLAYQSEAAIYDDHTIPPLTQAPEQMQKDSIDGPWRSSDCSFPFCLPSARNKAAFMTWFFVLSGIPDEPAYCTKLSTASGVSTESSG